MKNNLTSRQIAFKAVNDSLAGHYYIAETIQDWRKTQNPSQQEAALALEIASGAVRMAARLDWAVLQVSNKKKLSLKRNEKAILRCAIYQLLFLNGIAPHAAVNESVKLAKQHCHSSFVGFLNAVCRKLAVEKPVPPKDNLALTYSYPDYFVDALLKKYSQKETEEILIAGNDSPSTWLRRRQLDDLFPEGVVSIKGAPSSCGKFSDVKNISSIIENPQFYIQNVTQVAILEELLRRLPENPKRILDLCASPGGKALILADTFPGSEIHLNDISKNKLSKLKENIDKYQLGATLHCSSGETFQDKEPFDLVLIDAPCSNSGTFNRRAEARWRYTPELLKELQETQTDLIKNGIKQIGPNGHLIYLTCSISPEENENLFENNNTVGPPLKFLPTISGWDGGFGVMAKKEALHNLN